MSRIVLLACFLGPIWLFATTTSGGQSRLIQVDGQIGNLLPAGTNSNQGNWEIDEVFDGFMMIVDWFMTWDDDSLYLGRRGGNNDEASVIYLQAGFNGATFTNTGFAYDGLSPGLGPMGGINFAAYLRGGLNTYDEFRTWNGAWTAPAPNLEPRYGNNGAEDEMEVAIAWNDITGGNGRPDNVRAVFYQVVPPSIAGCVGGGAFIYGESPWGDGVLGNGPSIGVNDGDSTSAAQPGGCDVGTDVANRWWGCYPIIGGVGANGWNVQQPLAGPNDTICEIATAYILQGNAPAGQAVGTWQVISQPAGSSPVAFANPNAGNTIVQNLDGIGDYVFQWDINYGGCPSLPDNVVITRLAQPPVADAGPDQDLLCNLDNATLAGNAPGPATGTWTLVSGSGTIANPNDPNSAVTSLGFGNNVFEWSISNNACAATTDQVILTRFQPPTSLAGEDQELCQVSMTALDGIMPSLFGGNPVGTWSQVIGGPSTAVFTDVNAFNTTVTNLAPGETQLVWTLTNGTCPASSDTMSIFVSVQPVANAGPDDTLCFTDSYQLNAINPNLNSATAQLTWQQTFGPSNSTIQDPTLFNSQVEDLEPGDYKFLLVVTDGACPPESDVLNLSLYELQDQGTSASTMASFGMADGSATIADPSNGRPPYQFSLDGGNFSPDPTFSDLAPGTYTATIVDDRFCQTSFEFNIRELENPGQAQDTLAIVVPSGFSPNGDDINDTWLLENVEQYPDIVVEVYNEWGSRVFRSEGYTSPWNGTYNGKALPAATYYYILETNRAGEEVQKGPITIFR